VKHCTITGRLLVVCDCGGCWELDEAFGGDEDDGQDDEPA